MTWLIINPKPLITCQFEVKVEGGEKGIYLIFYFMFSIHIINGVIQRLKRLNKIPNLQPFDVFGTITFGMFKRYTGKQDLISKTIAKQKAVVFNMEKIKNK